MNLTIVYLWEYKKLYYMGNIYHIGNIINKKYWLWVKSQSDRYPKLRFGISIGNIYSLEIYRSYRESPFLIGQSSNNIYKWAIVYGYIK